MVPSVDPILLEFREEVPATRRILEKVPTDKLAWRPHSKSRSLGELATHIANLPGMAEKIVKLDEYAVGSVQPSAANSTEEILAAFEKNVLSADEALSGMTEQTAHGTWGLVFQGKELFRKPRLAALRTNLLNHWYHHRGQLSVYLRLLEVGVPVVYGPTADENPFI